MLMIPNPMVFALYAVIAAIALLIYNWDTVKEGGNRCMGCYFKLC